MLGIMIYRIAILASFASLLGLALPQPARAVDNMRCGTKLASVGDGKDKVRALCGEPTSVSFEGVLSRPRYTYGPHDYSYFGPSWIDVPVEVWTYNFGPQKLLRKLRFVGDELVDIETYGRGY